MPSNGGICKVLGKKRTAHAGYCRARQRDSAQGRCARNRKMQHGYLLQNTKSGAQDMLYHANVRFVARHIPEQLPSGLNCPCFFMDIENYSQLFCHASGSRFWKIRISNVICNFRGLPLASRRVHNAPHRSRGIGKAGADLSCRRRLCGHSAALGAKLVKR